MNTARNSTDRATKRLYLLVALLLVVTLAAFLLLNPDGLLSLSTLRNELEGSEIAHDSLADLRDSLRIRIELLSTDTTAIEEAIREILGWGRPGEFIIRIDSTSGNPR